MTKTSSAEKQAQVVVSGQQTKKRADEQQLRDIETGDIEKRVEEAHAVSSELSAENRNTRTARTGSVERLYDCSVDDASIKQIRRAASTSIEESGTRTDDEIREWAAESGHHTVVSLDITVVETDETHTLSWFESELPRELLLDLTGEETLSSIIQRNLPIVTRHGAMWVAGEREDMDEAMMSLKPEYMALIAQYEGTERLETTAEILVSAGAVGMFATFFATLFALGGSVSMLVPAVLLIATVVFTYGLTSTVWPTDTLYGRSLRPSWLS